MATLASPFFRLALAGLLRHQTVDELAEDLRRFKSKGYTGIWIENDYVRWTEEPDPDQGFNGNFRLFNLFDFTWSTKADLYRDYLTHLCRLCEDAGLAVYASFWLPKLNAEFSEYLARQHPRAIGRSRHYKTEIPTLCTCGAGAGLQVLSDLVERFLRDFPGVRGLKVSTEDNAARNCDDLCPNAHGTSKAVHAANMFAAVQRGMLAARPEAELLLYPWFWEQDFLDTIIPRLRGNYFVVTKMEEGSLEQSPVMGSGAPLFDCSLISGEPGPPFLGWIERVGPERIIDMVPVGTGIDDMFLANPPHPGRLFRRFQCLARHGVHRFLDFECGAHCAGSLEETVRFFNSNPDLSEDAFLDQLAISMYRQPAARSWAVRGWRSFDRGFGLLPVGLGDSGCRLFSGRFGFAWSMCIATPIVRSAFADRDREHEIHWFSPYNFFHGRLSLRLETSFREVLVHWIESARCLGIANSLEGESLPSTGESAAAEAHVLSVLSVLNWCAAAALTSSDDAVFREGVALVVRNEIELTEKFQTHLGAHPWIWANNCWHPHRTPLSQMGLGFLPADRDVFLAKLRIMNAAAALDPRVMA